MQVELKTIKEKTFKNFISTIFVMKLNVLSTPRVIICLTKIPTLQQSEFFAKARLREGQFLKEGLT
jgi:hypothetical protein